MKAIADPKLVLYKVVWWVKAFELLLRVRLGLTVLGLSAVRARLGLNGENKEAPQSTCDRCTWALTRASRWIPGATCLTQALAGQWLLDRMGFGSVVVIGVRPEDGQRLAAHAWLKSGDRFIVGHLDGDLLRFSHLTEFGSRE